MPIVETRVIARESIRRISCGEEKQWSAVYHDRRVATSCVKRDGIQCDGLRLNVKGSSKSLDPAVSEGKGGKEDRQVSGMVNG